MNIKTFVFFVLILLAFSTSSYAGCNEEKVEWSYVPAKAQQTITEHAQGGEVLRVKKETRKSIVIYEADGKKIEIKVNENDKLFEILDD